MRKLLFILLIVFLSLTIVSCGSTKIEEEKTLIGRVCSQSGKPVPGYEIKLDENLVITDSRGFFVFNNTGYGVKKVEGKKKGWSSINTKINFKELKKIFCIQVVETEIVYSRVKNLLFAGLLDEAEKELSTIKNGNESTLQFQFYGELIQFKKNNKAESKSKLLQLAGLKGGVNEN